MPEPSGQPDLYTRALAAADSIRAKIQLTPSVGIILGSGLGNFAAQVLSPYVIAYAEIPHWPLSTVAGHSGKLVLGHIAGVPVAVMQGRVHAYEGYAMEQVTFPTRVLGLLGCRTLIVTNAAGGIRPTIPQGSLVAISDHINLTGMNAALGPNETRFAVTPGSGERFFDMSTAYSPRLRALAQAEAAKQQIPLSEGVYVGVLGPSFETPAEIRAFRTLGADLVGMSTVHEVIVARHMGLEVLGISLVTNMAAGVVAEGREQADTIHHEEVMEIGRRVEAQFTSLLTALIPQLATVERWDQAKVFAALERKGHGTAKDYVYLYPLQSQNAALLYRGFIGSPVHINQKVCDKEFWKSIEPYLSFVDSDKGKSTIFDHYRVDDWNSFAKALGLGFTS